MVITKRITPEPEYGALFETMTVFNRKELYAPCGPPRYKCVIISNAFNINVTTFLRGTSRGWRACHLHSSQGQETWPNSLLYPSINVLSLSKTYKIILACATPLQASMCSLRLLNFPSIGIPFFPVWRCSCSHHFHNETRNSESSNDHHCWLTNSTAAAVNVH